MYTLSPSRRRLSLLLAPLPLSEKHGDSRVSPLPLYFYKFFRSFAISEREVIYG